MNSQRSLALSWYGGMLGGLLPVLQLGFLYSALADRTVFVLWALATGTCWVLLLRQGLGARWNRWRLLGALALLLAAGFAVFARLETKHHEILDLGFRAVFPAAYRPALTAPRTAGWLAGGLAVAGVICFARGGPHLPGPPLPEGEEGEKETPRSEFPSLPPGERGQGSEGDGRRMDAEPR